jgi:hypothetical protein
MYAEYPRNGKTSEIIEFTAFYVPLYSSGLITLLSRQTVKRQKVAQLVNEISQVHRVMVGRGIGLSMYRHTRSRIVLQLFLVFVIILPLWMLDLRDYCRLDCYRGYIGLVPFLMNTVEIIQFLNFVLILRKKYELLNECLMMSSLSASKTNGNTRTLAGSRAVNQIFEVKPSNTNILAGSRVVNQIFEVKPTCTSSQWNKSKKPGLEVHELRAIYSHLYDISHSISATYGISLLGIIGWLAMLSGSCIVFALQYFARGKIAVAIIMLFVVSLCLLAAVTIPCGITTDEANRSSVLVQKLLLRRDISETFIGDLDRFYTQLKSMDIRFTACGFFSLDAPLFFATVSAICTNLIVISQLK